MFSLLEQKAELETEVTRLKAEVSRKRQQLQGADFKLDIDACRSMIKCNEKTPSLTSTRTRRGPGPGEDEGGKEKKGNRIFSDEPDVRIAKDARFMGRYHFPTKPVPAVDASDPGLKKMLFEGVNRK